MIKSSIAVIFLKYGWTMNKKASFREPSCFTIVLDPDFVVTDRSVCPALWCTKTFCSLQCMVPCHVRASRTLRPSVERSYASWFTWYYFLIFYLESQALSSEYWSLIKHFIRSLMQLSLLRGIPKQFCKQLRSSRQARISSTPANLLSMLRTHVHCLIAQKYVYL